MMDKIELREEDIDSLSSETRRKIIKELRDRKMTLSELSRDLDLTKSTINEHLKNLMERELVEREEKSYGNWIYYSLTEKAKNILEPGKNIRIILNLSIVLLITGLFGIIYYLLDFYTPEYIPTRGGKEILVYLRPDPFPLVIGGFLTWIALMTIIYVKTMKK